MLVGLRLSNVSTISLFRAASAPVPQLTRTPLFSTTVIADGEVASSRSLEAAPICQQNKIPMVSPASTNPTICKGIARNRTDFRNSRLSTVRPVPPRGTART